MDANRFDAFVRSFTITAPRRSAIGALLGGGFALLLTRFGHEDAASRSKRKRKAKHKKACKRACAPCEQCKRGKCRPRPHGAACDPGDGCVGSACPCPVESERCGNTCVDLLTDSAHCGACNTPCPSGQSCLHGTCTCDPFNNSCPTEVDGQCGCGAVVADVFTAACVDRNSACDLDLPCQTSDDCPPRSVCLRGCADPPDPNPNRCSTPCVAV